MDYLNNDCAPDLMRFLQVKIGGKKMGCYYSFLQGIEEENLPSFSDGQIMFIKYCSSLLPLVRPHEYILIKELLSGGMSRDDINGFLLQNIAGCNKDEIDHTIKIMIKKGALAENEDMYSLSVRFDNEFTEYIEDLLEYGLIRISF